MKFMTRRISVKKLCCVGDSVNIFNDNYLNISAKHVATVLYVNDYFCTVSILLEEIAPFLVPIKSNVNYYKIVINQSYDSLDFLNGKIVNVSNYSTRKFCQDWAEKKLMSNLVKK